MTYSIPEERVKKAKEGNVEAAQGILKGFIGAVKQNTSRDGKPLSPHSPIDEPYVRYLAECFQEILNQMEGGGRPDANKALNLSSKKRGARKKTLERDMDIFLWVHEHASKAGNKRGSIKEAQKKYASKYNMSDDLVVKAYKRIKKRWFPIKENALTSPKVKSSLKGK